MPVININMQVVQGGFFLVSFSVHVIDLNSSLSPSIGNIKGGKTSTGMRRRDNVLRKERGFKQGLDEQSQRG